MSKLRLVALTAIVCIPLGAFAKDVILKGHPNLQKARASLQQAKGFIRASQEANEGVWGDEGGHGQKAKEMINGAEHELDLAAEWVNSHGK